MRWLDNITASVNMILSILWKIVEDRGVWCAAVHGIAKSHTRLSDEHNSNLLQLGCVFVAARAFL